MVKNKVLTDSFALTLVKLLTMAVSIVSTMVLSRQLDLVHYGTYSTGNLLINTATSLSALGLLDAVNYYYNGQSKENRKKYIDTVFALVILMGAFAGTIILVFGSYIQNYFHNPLLTSILIYVAFRPLLANLGLGMQNLQVSIGKAKVVAIRNSIISFSKLAVVIITAYITHNIKTIFICMLVVEAISLGFYYNVLYKNSVRIQPFNLDSALIGKILAYCIPMGIYIQTNALSRDLDKYVIGFFESTDKLAIYTNASTKLPFDVISGPLLMVLIPILTRCINNGEYENGLKLFKSNIKVGYTITFIIGAVVIALSKPAMLFLYGEKYLAGRTVFELYVLVDMINFISFSIVLGAKGKTKVLMIISSCALIVNLGINYLFYSIWGFTGPAYATVLVVFVTNCTLLHISAKVFNTNILNLFDWKHVGILLLELIIIATFIRKTSLIFEQMGVHYFISLSMLGLIGVSAGVLVNFKEVKRALAQLDEINTSSTH
ncbi:MAG: oligosaccharide flippase family protein [Streptococcus suis]